jgi:hypothetical protein
MAWVLYRVGVAAERAGSKKPSDGDAGGLFSEIGGEL